MCANCYELKRSGASFDRRRLDRPTDFSEPPDEPHTRVPIPKETLLSVRFLAGYVRRYMAVENNANGFIGCLDTRGFAPIAAPKNVTGFRYPAIFAPIKSVHIFPSIFARRKQVRVS